ncbi:Yip1 family protein [Pokkaliibacter sp. MBI-7]|uniref:Yip1 family protein n=1 Tax=Pokkaliibacter sp. MBI-7 TaxID=3040600 RepID=UPI00244A0E1E|nr:Yip1 family protein [Pokkaliibacter sp. MBI-7]MDH2436047.1 Yip1 family protein [Pokkaliibacter sp. MBI-7]
MINHIWGLLHHPDREWRSINSEGETISHLYTHHVLWLAAIPVISAYIGTTQVGWTLGGEKAVQVSMLDGLWLGIMFYVLIIGAVGFVGGVIHWMARHLPERPDLQQCVVFAGYIATPMFLSGLFALYPIAWLCFLAVVSGVCYTGYLLYIGTPSFLGISRKQGFILSSTTLGIGVLVLEALLAVVVLLWSMGSDYSLVWMYMK